VVDRNLDEDAYAGVGTWATRRITTSSGNTKTWARSPRGNRG
jgi:hypothetical protein